jgi:hypothetical protein
MFFVQIEDIYHLDTKWKQHGTTIDGGNRQGHNWKQLSKSQKVFVD